MCACDSGVSLLLSPSDYLSKSLIHMLCSRCVEVIKRVLSLHSHNWGQPMSPDTSLKENPPQVAGWVKCVCA